MIEVNDLTVEFNGRVILDNISMTIEKGEFVGILGPNGAGKTTLVKAILGLVKPARGKVLIDGMEPELYLKKRRGLIGYLPQHAIVNWNLPLKVMDAVLIESIKPFGFFRGHTESEIEKARKWLSVFGMDGEMDSYIRDLSGGQQQRVSLARCLIHDPEILILDEPNTAIDAVYNTKLYEILKELSRKHGITVVMVTHDIGAVTRYVDKIMCLNVKLHCHGRADRVDLSRVFKEVYGEDMEMVIHGDGCENCILNKRRQ